MVVYKNEFNTVPLRNFNAKEMDLLFSICSQMREKGLSTIQFSFEDLRELSDYKYTAHDRFIKDIEGVYDKLIKLDIKLGTATEFTKFVLFTKYSISAKNERVEIRINEEFKDILNNITGNFTRFELMEFTELQSSYSKTAYRLLKQFRNTGYWTVQIDEFRRLFDVPENYKLGNIDQRILGPIMRELPQYFKNLKISKLRGKGKRKKFVEYIEFRFEPEKQGKEPTGNQAEEQSIQDIQSELEAKYGAKVLEMALERIGEKSIGKKGYKKYLEKTCLDQQEILKNGRKKSGKIGKNVYEVVRDLSDLIE